MILEKYSPDFMESGMKYIRNDESKTTVFKIKVEQVTGKAGRR